MSELILVVDDEADLAELVAFNLERQGFRTAKVTDGRSAIDAACSLLPSLIILDLMMPNMDGFEFLRRLREDPRGQGIPVVVLSAMELTPEQRRYLTERVSDIVSKDSPPEDGWIANLTDSIRSCTLELSLSRQG